MGRLDGWAMYLGRRILFGRVLRNREDEHIALTEELEKSKDTFTIQRKRYH
jgi:hypothetical protein